MILLDTNLLLYAYVSSFPQHDRAKAWLDSQLNSVPVGLPWPTVLGFVRLTTNPRVFAQPTGIAEAWNQVSTWLDCEKAWIPQPTERHREIVGDLLIESNAQGKLVPDAHLAALALEHGLVLCSTDGDFDKFPGLRWQNPLLES